MVKLAKHPYEDLLEFLDATFGNALHWVVLGTPGGPELLYSRDRPSAINPESPPNSVIGSRWIEDEGTMPRSAQELDCLIGATTDVYEVVFYPNPETDILVSFDRNVEIDLHTFIRDSLEILQ